MSSALRDWPEITNLIDDIKYVSAETLYRIPVNPVQFYKYMVISRVQPQNDPINKRTVYV